MPSTIAVMGPAGTGKTTRLLELVGDHAARLLKQPHQRLLAMSFMNGARARLETAIKKTHPAVPRTVSTLDRIAAKIVNRWRVGDDLTFPVASAGSMDAAGPTVQHFRTRLPFNDIVMRATRMLRQPIASSWFAESFPLVVVDEFQDCHGVRLEFVQALSAITQVLLAADDFQLLDSDFLNSCPAVEWIQSEEMSQNATVERLTLARRTNKKGLLGAAHALRFQEAASQATIPVTCAPGIPLLASRCMYFMLNNWSGTAVPPTWALLTTSLDDPNLHSFLRSLNSQLEKKGSYPITWITQASGEVERSEVFTALGVGGKTNDDAPWTPVSDTTTSFNKHVCNAVRRFAQLRGVSEITHGLVRQFAETAIHSRSAYRQSTPRFLLTTIHGAKNREFDNVVVFWGFKRPADTTAQRKLLYNAITRARNASLLLAFDPKKQIEKSPVLNLLGSIQVLGRKITARA